ncbi:hypothetical protein GHT09_010510 [Marmota monax]|uniref:OCEL domain-containing protein n=1 Tax=Marmota monax TaxID=9995 RepID=A0A834V0J4_MARMO|nr:hypothetical protein GHT09_010510 [Marmota monax]
MQVPFRQGTEAQISDAGTGRPQTAPATRGPRRPPRDPPPSSGTWERPLPEADAGPGAFPGPRRPGDLADPPAWPWAPDHKTSAPRPRHQPQPAFHKARPRKIVFEDELNPQALLVTKKPTRAIRAEQMPRPHPSPDYELKYPPVSSERERSRYVAVFQDQYGEFLELRQEVGSTQAKLQQLEALMSSLPPPQSQKEAQVAARIRREFEKKWRDPSFLDKQLRCRYLKAKLRHLKTQIQKFDDQEDSEGSVYF